MSSRRGLFLVSLPILLAVGGCNKPSTNAQQSGLMNYLSPSDSQSKDTQTPPNSVALRFPFSLGIAMVPASLNNGPMTRAISPETEDSLLKAAKISLKDVPWLSEIKLVPSNYLKPGGGFANLAQVARMCGVDAVALVSLDQIQYRDPKWYSFTYYSVIGAYVMKGDKDDTRTVIDAAVFDIGARSILFRASGQSVLKGSSTWFNRDEAMRLNADQGIRLAMADLSLNLTKEAAAFKPAGFTGKVTVGQAPQPPTQ
jgi:rhombotail lipoprotein